MLSGFSEAKNENIPKLSGQKRLRWVCFPPLEPFELNEQQLAQAMNVSTTRQLDFDDDICKGEKNFIEEYCMFFSS